MTTPPRLLVVLASGLLASCSTIYQLDMSPEREPVDETVEAPALRGKQYSKVMVLPPSGTKRGQFDPQVAQFEREFLRNRLTVISGAVTGRVVFDDTEDENNRVEGASPLSDAERALVMAAETGADAILQIGRFEWSTNPRSGRFFVIDPATESAWREVSFEEFQNWGLTKLQFPADQLTFVGRLTDVESGEVIASFQIESSVNWNLASRYLASYSIDGNSASLLSQNFDYAAGQWQTEAREDTIERVIRRVAERIVGAR